eukprot:gene27282-biopygen17796
MNSCHEEGEHHP